jgi:hypothetical protein
MGNYTRPVKKILTDNGCRFVRHGGRGDHDIWYSPITNENFTVDGKITKRTSANETLKDAGVKQKV